MAWYEHVPLLERFVNKGVGTSNIEVEKEVEDSFNGISDQNLWKLVSQIRQVSSERSKKFEEYKHMLNDSVIQSAIELMADDATQTCPDNEKTVWIEEIEGSDKKTVKALNDWLLETVKIEEYIWTYAYNVISHGELFLRTFHSDKEFEKDSGTERGDYFELETDPVKVCELLKYGKTIGYYVNEGEGKDKYIYNAKDFIHFLSDRGHNREDIIVLDTDNEGKDIEKKFIMRYGTSFIEPARSAYRILKILEDVLVMSRIVRSSMFRIFQIEVGSAGKKETLKIINDIKRAITSRETFNKVEDLYNSDKSPIPIGSNIYSPRRNQKGDIQVEEVGGNVDVKDIIDIEYFRNKVFAALKIPKAFLGWEECLRANTKIRLLDGTVKTIKEIVDNKDEYIGKPILSCNEDGEIVPTIITHAKKTRKDANFVRVHLDNGKYVDATPDHLFMLRDGSFREAGDLVKEDFIMSNTFQEINEIEIRLDVKVVRVEQLDIIEDAYDLGVENESHVFALDAGIFVHNSIPGGMNNTSLTKLDIRYARTIKRIQSVLKNGIRDMCNYWLFINDKKDKIDKFKVKMTKITSSEDAEKSEEMESLIRLADSIHNLVGRDYEDLLNKREFLIWLSNDIMKIEGMEKVIKSKEEWEKEQEESDDDDGDDRGGFGGF